MSHSSISPNVFDDERIVSRYADFRCEICEGRYPFSLLVVEDGHKVCKPNCAHETSLSEREQIVADAQVEATRISSEVELQNAARIAEGNLYSLMDGVSACTGLASGSTVYPDQISLTAGGSSVPLVLTGIAFVSAVDSLTASHAGITYGSATVSSDQTTWTTTVAASGAVSPGEYDFLFNGNRFLKAFRVR